MDDVDSLWSAFDPSVAGIISEGTAGEDKISVIASQNLPLLKAMNKTVKLYETAATGNEMNAAVGMFAALAQ